MNQPTNTTSPGSPSATILVVDDDAANLSVMSDYLREYHFRVIVARDGESALTRAEYGKPDLILLDVLMPNLDGFETCRRLKEREALRDIPVIFMTALSDTADKVAAFHAGGEDYISKPFQQEEVLARIQTHLKLRKQRLDLLEAHAKLLAMEQMRNDLVHMIVHDLRTPIWGIHGYLELLAEMLPDADPEAMGIIAHMTASSSQLLEMVSTMLDVNKMESGTMKLCLEECNLESITHDIFIKLAPLAGCRTLAMERAGETTGTCVKADEGLLSRVIENLVSNAIKYTQELGGDIRVLFDVNPHRARVCVRDNGYGIPPECRNQIFEKYGQVLARLRYKKYSTGLGLPFCKLAVEAHGGRIWLENTTSGATICFEIPCALQDR